VRFVAFALIVGCGSPREPAAPPAPTPPPGDAAAVAAEVVDAAVAASADAAPAPPSPPPTGVAPRIELTFAGDIMFGGTFSGRWVPQEAGSFDPLKEIAPQLASDLALVNLETTVVAEIPVAKLVGDLRFAARPDQVATLPRNGVRAVTIANNHAADIDGPGVRETPGHLRDLGITIFGAARTEPPLVRVEPIDVRGWNVGIIAATTRLNRGQARGDPKIPLVQGEVLAKELVPLVKAARANHDLVIVVLHWGVQYADNPDQWQVNAAHAFIDAGADAVIGHHPHILQRFERYKDGLIAYSLGNFLFNNALPGQRNTAVLRLGFANHAGKRCLDLVVVHPAAIYPSPVHHPKPVTGKLFDEIEARVIKLSAKGPAPTKWRAEGGRLVAPAVCPK
jgi:poly-gamma-glutamate capsule biosynthesis protein CapA/YwtB (metallophosphatase superfamily)